MPVPEYQHFLVLVCQSAWKYATQTHNQSLAFIVIVSVSNTDYLVYDMLCQLYNIRRN
jgi:hypothetical protein